MNHSSSGDAYTCNCTGDYSFIPALGNLRVGALQGTQGSINTGSLALLVPFIGAWESAHLHAQAHVRNKMIE